MTGRGRNGCRSGRRSLLRYVDADLDAGEALGFEIHVEGCPACRAALAFHQRLEELLHRDTLLEPDAGFEARIAAGVRRRLAGPAPGNSGRRLPSRRAVRSAAALLALTAGAGWLLDSREHRTPPSAPASPRAPAERPGATALREAVRQETVTGEATGGRVAFAASDVEPARLRAVEDTVRDALVQACSAPDFRASFRARTADLKAARWPVDALVVNNIGSDDPELACLALKAAAELGLKEALPATRRAALRPETAPLALVAMGALGDGMVLACLERALDQPELADAAIEGLRLQGSAAAAHVLAERCRGTLASAPAQEALLAMGTPGVGELLRLAADGDVAARQALRAAGLPSPRQLQDLLDPASDPAVVAAAIQSAPALGADAVPPLLALRSRPAFAAAALEALAQIPHPAAVAAMAGLLERGEIGAGEGAAAVVQALSQALDPGVLLAQACARGHGAALVDALSLAPAAGHLVPSAFSALIAAEAAPGPARAAAALHLAQKDALEPDLALRAGCSLAARDADASAALLIAAARAGADLHRDRLGFLSRAAAGEVRERAAAAATRWKRDGDPPTDHERRRLARLLQSAAPRL